MGVTDCVVFSCDTNISLFYAVDTRKSKVSICVLFSYLLAFRCFENIEQSMVEISLS